MKAYHGSTQEFDKFSLDKFDRGDYGHGIYFTRDKGYAQNYGTVKQYEIPDMDYLLDIDISMDYQSEYVQQCLQNIIHGFIQKGDLQSYNKFTDVAYADYCNTGWNMYEVLWDICGSAKLASKFLDENGIKGLDASFKNNCFVIFNPDNIKQLTTVSEDNKIYYHGSNYKFDTFDKSKIKENKLGLCFNFTDDLGIAYQYGDNILKVKLQLNNPLTLDVWDDIFPYKYYNLLYKKLCNTDDDMDKQEYEQHPETIGDMFNIYKMRPEFVEVLQEMGYDGLAFPENHHYGVFEPEQIIILNEYEALNEQLKKYL
jgi:hypothetical protein